MMQLTTSSSLITVAASTNGNRAAQEVELLKASWRTRVQILRAFSFFSSKTTLVADLESEKWVFYVEMWLFIFFENILEK